MTKDSIMLSMKSPASRIVVFAMAFLGIGTAFGARQDVITEMKMFLARDAVHPGETFKAALLLSIGPGWHINANPVNDDFLIPTTLEFRADRDFKVVDTIYPPPLPARFEFSESEVFVYAESALIGVLFKAGDKVLPGTSKLKGALSYQACNDSSCLPPETLSVEFEVKVVDFETLTGAVNAEIFSRIRFDK
jgi:DsbC/DsbD-like thiol-disulfide interchange protein